MLTTHSAEEATAATLKPRKFLIALLILFVGVLLGRYVLPAGSESSSPLRYITTGGQTERQLVFPTFWEAWDQLHEKFDGDLDDRELFYGAVSGMIRAAGDPYTAFSGPDETKQFEETLEGSFFGVGVEIGMRNGLVTVIAPLEGSPAKNAGVREGDIVVAVDHKPLTQEATLDEVVNQIRGQKGTKVTLTVVHDGDKQTTDIEITRDRIQIESVKLKIEEGIAHMTITNFNGDTSDRFEEASRQAVKAGVKGIILDVRNNPGGFLQSAVDISSLFLQPGTVVVSEKGKVTTQYTAKGTPLLTGIPVVVVVNGGSASASEILAGALNDQLNAPIVGTKTFGKGSVQEFVKLDDGSSLRVTIAKWYTPKDRNINDQGIEATVNVEQNFETPEDEVLLKAQEEIKRLVETPAT